MRFTSRSKVNIALLALSVVVILSMSFPLLFPTKSRVQAASQTDWPMFGFDAQHTHYNPNETVLNPTNVSGLTLDWSLPSDVSSDNSSVVVNGVLYVASNDGKLYAIDTTTHILKWNSITVGQIISSPAVANGTVYVGSQDHNLYAFNTNGCGNPTCPPIWSYTTGGVIYSSPVVVNGLIYFGSDDGNLYALDASTGTLQWNSTTGGPIQSSPAVDNGVVYIGSQDHNLYAFDATGCGSTSCSPLWSYPTGGLVTFSSPAVANGVVYVGSTDHTLYAIDTTTHFLKWSDLTGGFIRSSPAVANGVVYVGSWDDNVYAFDAMTGALIWYHPTGAPIDSSPAIANGVVYIGSTDNHLYAFNATGCGSSVCQPLLNYPISIALSSPVVVNGEVYVSSSAFHLPGPTLTTSTSPNWSGYEVYGPDPHTMTFSIVEGSWRQPTAVTCSKKEVSGADFWVGFADAFQNSNGTLGQIGTQITCVNGKVENHPWYEVRPQQPFIQLIDKINKKDVVKAHDLINAKVSFVAPDTYTLNMSDMTQNWTFSISVTQPGAEHNSAEWIAEDPLTNSGHVPFTNFGSITFFNCTVDGNAISNGPIINEVTLFDSSTNTEKATPSSLYNSDGKTFDVTWRHK